MATRKEAPATGGKGKSRSTKSSAKAKTASAAKAPSGLSNQQELFCLEYCKDRNATQAAIRAGYSKKAAKEQGYHLLTRPHVRARVNDLLREHARSLKIETSDVLKRLWDTATGDVNDIVRLEHRCCRFCWGIDHEYQWKTQREFRKHYDAEIRRQFGIDDLDKLIEVGRKFDAGERIPGMPDDAGGYGFDATASPNPDCPECHGEGDAQVVIPDTREALSHPLYEGVKQTQHGIEVKIADRSKALEQIARHLQMFKDQVEVTASQDLLEAARKINASSPPLDARYMRSNADRLRAGDQEGKKGPERGAGD